MTFRHPRALITWSAESREQSISIMWLQLYRAARAVVLHPRQLARQPISQLLTNVFLNFNLLGDRRYMTQSILPALASAKVKQVLFVGSRPYTAHYGKRLTRAGIDYWTTDIDPEAADWGEKGHHIVCDIAKIDEVCASESFDAVLLNGVFGFGVDENNAMDRTIEAIARVLCPKGILLIGWNTKKTPDPTELEAVRIHFCREQVLPLPLRKTFGNSDHVYDWLVKTNGTQAVAATSANSDRLVKS